MRTYSEVLLHVGSDFTVECVGLLGVRVVGEGLGSGLRQSWVRVFGVVDWRGQLFYDSRFSLHL